MISTESRPRLAAKARLRFDRKTERYLLLYPEKGLLLNPTAADVIQLCTGEHTVGAIVERLATKYTAHGREAIEGEIMVFLDGLADRGLLEAGA